jgi:hypothetical protein
VRRKKNCNRARPAALNGYLHYHNLYLNLNPLAEIFRLDVSLAFLEERPDRRVFFFLQDSITVKTVETRAPSLIA